ncbi:unnamed protein product, partial [Symbiodinium necroappetens]
MASTSTASENPAPGSDEKSTLPWAAIPRYVPGVTDTTEYAKKIKFLADVWPKEQLSVLGPRVALLCEGTAFKKVSRLDAAKLKANDTSGVELIVRTLGGAWGQTILEEKYEQFEKAIYGTVQRNDETHDSYLARHDIHFEELLAQNITFEELRSYILLRQSQLSSDDKKRIVVEHSGKLTYEKVKASIRLLGSKFFGEMQGQRSSQRHKVYDANTLDEALTDEPEKAFQASTAAGAPNFDELDNELEPEYLEALAASEDADALQIQAFEEELEGFFQETPDLQEALVSYMEARGRLLAKKKSRGFWPVSGGGKGNKGGRSFKGGKGKGKSSRDQLLARIARSVCRACGEKGHWKAECPKFGRPGSMSGKGEATTTMAEVVVETAAATMTSDQDGAAVLITVPEEAITLAEAYVAYVLNEPIKAILDTGASRCVMGKCLLATFVSQLSDATRALIKVMKSSVKFRFGNNQTLLSELRVLLPFCTGHQQILWLAIEIVPGSTPLLFSKKALKQLGGVIDTCEDVCHLKLLQKKLHLSTGPTGLYTIDLARLCEESSQEQKCQLVCEDSSVGAVNEPSQTSKDPSVNTSQQESAKQLSAAACQCHVDRSYQLGSPLCQVEDMTIDFGKAMKGRTYLDVVENEGDWTKWFLDHFKNSEKHNHKAFMIFVEKYVKQSEQIEAELLSAEGSAEPATTTSRTAAPKPKPKAYPRHAVVPSDRGPTTDQWDLLSVSGELEPALDNQVSSLATRMTQLEHVMEQVLMSGNSFDKSGNLGKPPAYLMFGTYMHGGIVGVDEDDRELWIAGQSEQEHADNSQTIRRALLRRSNPVRGPYKPGDWVLYWMRKGSASITGVNDQAGSSGSFEANNEVSPTAAEVPIPDDDDDGLFTEEVLLASPAAGVTDADGQDLLTFTALHTSACASGLPLAEDDLPYVEQPLECQEDQAFCLEIPVKAKDIKRWSQEANPEHMVQLAAVSKRARAEVHVKGEYVKNIPQIDIGWMRALWGVVHVPEFRWQQPEESYKKLNLAIIVTDCKSLYDLVTRLAMPACEEHRTTLEVLLIKQRCAENTCFRWIPTTLQAADCLTKVMDATLLRTVLSQGRFKLFDTSKVLEK